AAARSTGNSGTTTLANVQSIETSTANINDVIRIVSTQDIMQIIPESKLPAAMTATLTPPETKGIKIYPNPTTDGNMTVEFEMATEEPTTILLFDVAGKQVYSKSQRTAAGKNSVEVSAQNLPQGLYLLTVKTDAGMLYTQKVQIQH
ncbi:MAG: Secretion system C-terminal sorting domain, partial [Bacteroidota bacterium]